MLYYTQHNINLLSNNNDFLSPTLNNYNTIFIFIYVIYRLVLCDVQHDRLILENEKKKLFDFNFDISVFEKIKMKREESSSDDKDGKKIFMNELSVNVICN